MWRNAAAAVVVACSIAGSTAGATEPSAQPGNAAASLRPAAEFAAIADRRARSRALFAEAGKVLQSPRCLNCHPVSRSPTQGDDLHAHTPPISESAAIPCNSCHGAGNVATQGDPIRSVPGSEHWALAPASMGWQQKSLADICAQLKDRDRNGGRSLAKVRRHMAEDHLVGWAWHPGEGRTPAPGTQEAFGELITAWIESGAHCPED